MTKIMINKYITNNFQPNYIYCCTLSIVYNWNYMEVEELKIKLTNYAIESKMILIKIIII